MHKKIFQYLITLLLVFATFHTYASMAKPGFIVTAFSGSMTIAPNSNINVLIVAQNNTSVEQTITSVAPIIPANTGITASIEDNNCGLLLPEESCPVLVHLQSGNVPSSGNLNISICSFNGAFCSRMITPVTLLDIVPMLLFVLPTDPTIANGTTNQFHAIALFPDFNIEDVTTSASWSSSDTTKATISSAGLATGVGGGSSLITASFDGLTPSTTLTVTTATLTSITVTPTNPSIANGNSQQFIATGIFSDNTSEDLTNEVTWTSSNTAVATISNVGKATAKSVGSITITAQMAGVSGTTSLTVKNATLTSISVTPTKPKIIINTTQQFTATGIYSDNSTQDLTSQVTWKTQSSSIAIISNQANAKGKAVGVGTGSTNVIATLGSVSGSATLQVTAAVLTAIDVLPINKSLAAGTNLAYTARGIYNNNRTEDLTTSVTWLSSNTAIATISNATGSQGLAHGVSNGTVTISARFSNVVGSTHLTVNSPTLQSITVSPALPSIDNGTHQQFTATGNYSNGTTQNITNFVTWISGTPSVAEILNATGSKGLATSISAGTSAITAAFLGVIGSTTLTVTNATITSIAVTPANPSVPIDTEQQFTAIGTFSDSSTLDITEDATWLSANNNVATVSDAAGSHGLATGVDTGSTTISAIFNGVTGSTTMNVISVNIGDSLQGGVVACLGGDVNNLIATSTDNTSGIVWGGNGIETDAESFIDGAANTTTIVSILGAGTTYAAGLCNAYEIDSLGNSPCVGGNTCYNDWFLPSSEQITCLRENRNQIGNFDKVNYWSSTEDPANPTTKAYNISFKNSGQPAATASKSSVNSVRCVRMINGS